MRIDRMHIPIYRGTGVILAAEMLPPKIRDRLNLLDCLGRSAYLFP